MFGCDLFWDDDPLPVPPPRGARPPLRNARHVAPDRNVGEPSVSAAIEIEDARWAELKAVQHPRAYRWKKASHVTR